ncbi:ABC transporter permease [Timonella sp. A28]|uniref:ABC transporter permease n=1 Tax=Timonella sp. A28 TaxID=3442640 RepID=UPI003EB8A524
MLRITFYQMRQNIGRLSAAGLAILIGTAFVAATFMGGQVLMKATERAMTASYADADLVVTAESRTIADDGSEIWNHVPITNNVFNDIKNIQGVHEAIIINGPGLNLTNGTKSEFLPSSMYAHDNSLNSFEIVEGNAPTAATDIAIPQKLSERMELSVGDTIQAETYAASEQESALTELTISGLSKDIRGGYSVTGGVAVLSFDGMKALAVPDDPELPAEVNAAEVLISMSDSADAEKVRADITAIAGERGVHTVAELSAQQLENFAQDAKIMTYIVLGFAAIALFVAALVISNTFQVLVAQRTRTLALLRCVGANKKQIRRSVLVEALILGFVSSILGIVAGIALVQGILSVVAALEVSASVPEFVSIPPATIWAPIVAGVGVTVLASLVPARIATKVSPLAALRPQEGAGEVKGKAGVFRLVIAALFVLTGCALIAFAFQQPSDAVEIAMLLGISGGALTFVGLIVSSVLWVPAVVSAVGAVFSRLGAPAKLAAANVVRNPRRTASTSTALFIGVTLVSLLAIGASTAKQTLNDSLDSQFPLDVIAEFTSSEGADDKTLTEIKNISGVEEAQAIRQYQVEVSHGYNASSEYIESTVLLEYGDDISSVLRDTSALSAIKPGEALYSAWGPDFKKGSEISFFKVTDENYEVAAQDTPGWGNRVVMKSAGASGLSGFAVNSDEFNRIASSLGISEDDIAVNTVFIKVADVNDAKDTVDALRDYLGETNVYLSGAVMERMLFQQAIDVMLMVLVGLLGVAVIIALIGVANTLSLSVIERRRESATLRAVGMSRKQLRLSLAFEGMLIAGIGALVGVLLGGAYAWIGTELMFSGFTDPTFTVRWFDIAAIFGIALGAGLLASVLPSRSAAKTSPVEALAVE